MTLNIDQQGNRRRSIHGVTLGILMLDTYFQRLPGDIGNGATWPFPVQYAIVRGATPQKVVEGGAVGVLDGFLRAIDELVDIGVDGIGTGCGFLAKLHPQLVAHSPVPMATSSLLQISFVQSMLPAGKQVGVLTADEDALTEAHFAGVGLKRDMPIAGLALDGVMKKNHRTNATVVDYDVNESEVMAVATRLLSQNPNVGAIVSECTNFAPYSAAISRRFRIPVYDVVTMLTWFQSGLSPKPFV